MATAERKPNGGELVLTSPEPRAIQPMELIDYAVRNNGALEVIQTLVKMQREAEMDAARSDFNHAIGQCQEEAKLVINDSDKTAPGGKRWATYKAIDAEIRPIYRKYGLSLSFGSRESAVPDQVIVTCVVAKGIFERTYEIPMDASGKGPKGDGALSKPHATLAAVEYGRRVLVKMIFNLITGDEDGLLTNKELVEALEKIDDAGNVDVLTHYYREAYKLFDTNPDAIKAIVAAKIKRQKALTHATR